MKNSQILLVTLGLTATLVLQACSGKAEQVSQDLVSGVNPIVNPTPEPQPEPGRDNCPNLTGTYQTNADNFSFRQDGCAKVTRSDHATGEETTLLTDNVEREQEAYGNVKSFEKSYFSDSTLHIETRFVIESQPDFVVHSRYFFSTKPCDLANPDGTNYLTLEVRNGNQTQPQSCDFWAKH